ncbi:MAG: dipicolinate synthase subunit DpsA, partial [Clostridia bacterium]
KQCLITIKYKKAVNYMVEKLRKTYGVFGGDQRYVELCNLLCQRGKKVYAFGYDRQLNFDSQVILCGDITAFLKQCDVIIFPLPITKDKVNLFTPLSSKNYPLQKIFFEMKDSIAVKNNFVFGGKISQGVLEDAKEAGIDLKDYLTREDFAIYNAVPTAEGAIQIAMEQLQKTIATCNILLMGFGRISCVLAKMLKGIGANVTVCARKSHQLAWAEIADCNVFNIKQLDIHLEKFDIIMNTIPTIYLTAEMLELIKKDCLIIDLASAPGGVDFISANQLKLNVINAQSLPGKVAPITSGKIIMDVVETMCDEKL